MQNRFQAKMKTRYFFSSTQHADNDFCSVLIKYSTRFCRNKNDYFSLICAFVLVGISQLAWIQAVGCNYLQGWINDIIWWFPVACQNPHEFCTNFKTNYQIFYNYFQRYVRTHVCWKARSWYNSKRQRMRCNQCQAPNS